MDKFKATLFIFLCLSVLLCSSCIYATDVNETTADTDDLQTVDETVTDTPALKANDNKGSFDELDNIIKNLKPGDTYNIDKNYRFDDAGTTGRCISIGTDNITINGNGYYLDGNNNAVTFKITGNNVSILNLVIYNCQGYGETMTITIDGNPSIGYSTTMSPVYWKGANGTMSNCYLIENSALNGGALTWTGSNGIINNSVFMNNTAKGAGGSIYLNGENATITNTIFINSTSKLLNEAIYLDRKQSSFNLDNIECDHLFCINGSNIGVDSDNLRKSYMTQFGGETIDLIPIIYSSLFSINALDNQTYYYGQFSKETQSFTLVLIRNFDEYGITYENEYVIKTNSIDEIFAGLVSNYYTVNTKVIKTANVNTIEEYNAICHSNIDNDIFKTPVMDIIRNDEANIHNFKSITYMLNVNYKNNTLFISNEQWDENIGYDIILVNGNGATVHAITEEDDEYHWIVNTHNKTFAISNLTIEGFNTAIRNLNGTFLFNDVTFNRNRLDYLTETDNGGAIVNAGILICNNCTFSNNHAKNGGAIFTQGLLILENCTFENNEGYGTGNDVLNVDQGTVILNGNNTPVDPVTYVESISSIRTSIISFICSVGVIAFTFLATCIAFMASAANPAVALCVGIGVGVALGGLFGSIGGYAIASQQYNLDYNKKATFIGFLSGMITLGITTAAISGSYFSKLDFVQEARAKQFIRDENAKLDVYVDGQYYEIGSDEIVYDLEKGWIKKIDVIIK